MPNTQSLFDITRASQLVTGPFLGQDQRPLQVIINADAAALARLGVKPAEIAEAMQKLTDRAAAQLGLPVKVGANLEVTMDDHRGRTACPWRHDVQCLKRNTQVKFLDTGQTLYWSDLSIHLIAEHGFFQGQGSPFRLEPVDLARILES